MRTEEEMKHSNEKQFGFQLANQLLEFVEFWFKVLERKNLQEESSFFFCKRTIFSARMMKLINPTPQKYKKMFSNRFVKERWHFVCQLPFIIHCNWWSISYQLHVISMSAHFHWSESIKLTLSSSIAPKPNTKHIYSVYSNKKAVWTAVSWDWCNIKIKYSVNMINELRDGHRSHTQSEQSLKWERQFHAISSSVKW